MRPPPRSRGLSLWVAGSTVFLGAALLGSDTLSAQSWPWAFVGVAVASGVTLSVAVLVCRDLALTPGALMAVLALGLIARLATLPSDRFLSDDAFRYHWDGRVGSAGFNPYRYAPNDPALADLVDHELHPKINHPHLPTVYPPLAQHLFSLAYRLTPKSLLGYRFLVLFSELVALALLVAAHKRLGLPAMGVVWVAWSPLAILEGYLPGHVDTLTLPWLVAFLWLVHDRRATVSGIALAATCAIKPFAVIFAPAALRQLGWRRGILAAGGFMSVMALVYWPFWAPGARLFESTLLMARQWSYNGSLAAIAEWLLPRDTARLLSATLLLVAIGLATWLGRDLNQRLGAAALAFVAFTPTLFPWYLIGLLPVLAWRLSAASVALVALLPLAEITAAIYRLEGVWQPLPWTQWVIYLPFFGLLTWQLGSWAIARRAVPQK